MGADPLREAERVQRADGSVLRSVVWAAVRPKTCWAEGWWFGATWAEAEIALELSVLSTRFAVKALAQWLQVRSVA